MECERDVFNIKIVKKKYNIINALSSQARRENRLLMAQIDVTNKCNCDCSFCFLGRNHVDKNQTMTTEEIFRCLSELKQLGVLHLGFSGGEPFCRKDFLQILSRAVDLGFKVTFVSNLQVCKQDDMNILSDIGVSKVLVSFHSTVPEKYGRIFGISPSMFNRALNNIRTLIRNNQKVGITVTVQNENIEEMAEIKEFFINEGVKTEDIRFNMLLRGNNPVSGLRGQDLIAPYLKNNQDLKYNILSKSRLHGENCFLCTAGRTSLNIKYDGTIVPCGFLNSVCGNIRENTISEIWGNSHTFKLIRGLTESDFSMCSQCSALENCPICIANNLNETGQATIPSYEYCSYRKSISNAFD